MSVLAHHKCKDCLALSLDERPSRARPAPHPGPRCASHHRARSVVVKARAHQNYVAKTYGLPPGLYDAIYQAQGGRCAWCGLSDGGTKKLAVDHDHACCPGPTSCGRCVRGLLDSVCNQFLGFRMRDDPEAIRRGARYLERPPAQEVYLAWNGP